jgi:hypothetical protein
LHRLNVFLPKRRDFMQSSMVLTIAGTLSGTGLLASRNAWSQTTTAKPIGSVKALFFDVFGTLVDWRSGVARKAAFSLHCG